MHLPAAGENLSSPPCRDRAAIAANDGIIAQSLAQFPCDHLGLHWFVAPGGALLHDLPPIFHPRLRRLKKTPILLASEQRNQFLQGIPAVADQAYLDGIAQADALGIEFNLHSS